MCEYKNCNIKSKEKGKTSEGSFRDVFIEIIQKLNLLGFFQLQDRAFNEHIYVRIVVVILCVDSTSKSIYFS